MHTGQYISGAGHLGLIVWLLLGPVFSADPPEMQVTDVSVISSEEFAALTEASNAPQSVPEPTVPQQPDIPEDTAPDVPADAPAPEQVAEPQAPAPEEPADAVPDVPETAPLPSPDVSEPSPQPEPPAPDPEPDFDVPTAALRPQPRPAPRVAPEPVAPPEPDVTIADQTQTAPDPEATTDTPPDAEETTAEAEAATEIVTEAEEPAALAPTRSVRPRTRPERVAATEPETQAETQPPATTPDAPAPQPSVSEDAVQAALAEALGGAADPEPSAPSGPPLNRSEREAFRVAVQECWNVNVGSEAANVTVTLAMSLDRSGAVVGAIRLVGSEGGNASATQTAFETARRAVQRCEKGGYDLPAEKYEQWRDIEMTFNPEKMRLR
ncbi:cell envelope biogenesis protein TolA [Primorskyibacter flagellatus]|uniref:cell envelope biogenesis protein TolA n=1 Tax=Primorskyibacter flagellatus TaxID=1387277 RepID=UPI003A92DAC5